MSLEVRAVVARATRGVVPLWPLSSFIAVNPLGAREAEPFATAASFRPREAFLADYAAGRITDADLITAATEASPELLGGGEVAIDGITWSPAALVAHELIMTGAGWPTPKRSSTKPDLVNELVAKWLGAYLDPRSPWPMPDRSRGLWSAWSAMASYDPQLPRVARRRIRSLPAFADEALSHALAGLGLIDHESERALREEAEQLPGWVAHIKWRAAHVGDIDMTTYLAIRMTLRWVLERGATKEAPPLKFDQASPWQRADALIEAMTSVQATPALTASVVRILALHPAHLHPSTWQSAYEGHYRASLGAELRNATENPYASEIQVVMCIDPRSEGMRRHLEIDPQIETLGFAGFFGVPMRFTSHQARGSIDALPALIAARHLVTEVPSDPIAAANRVRTLRVRDAFAAGIHASETAPAAPFALAESVGWFLGLGTLVRTLAPNVAQFFRGLRERAVSVVDSEVTIADAFALEERAAFAETGIRMMGLSDCSPLVVLVGHGSTSTNNLYQSALDCGACGGNPGAANARAAAAIFNDVEVRQMLRTRGIDIAGETHFVAAEHNTVSDRVEILDRHLIPRTLSEYLRAFEAAAAKAADLLVLERARLLPGAHHRSVKRLRQRAYDWAEVYPELGLAGNAAMIIGPREMTRGSDLGRRVFLHSYRPELDPDGLALETIMTAPLVVAQWINHQYYFSTVDKMHWGAGTKTIHNAIGTIGVLAGQTGDLQLGLPLQSVAVGGRDIHEPQRLIVLIQAPVDRVGAIISRNQVLRNLFDNDWISLSARDDDHGTWHRYGPYGWTPDTHLEPARTGEQ